MVFPWVGLFEQVRLSDVFVHYDDVQFPRGRSFMSRVQIKTPQGVQWLTIPVRRDGVLIKDIRVDNSQAWRKKHLRTLESCYAKSPFANVMLSLVERVYDLQSEMLSDLNCFATEEIAGFFGLSTRFLRSSTMSGTGHGTERLLDLVRRLEGTNYITGHGARHYFEHELFDASGITVEYMTYSCAEYPQLHGPFTPYVSILDLIANVGSDGAAFIRSGTMPWRLFVQTRPAE